MESPETPRPFDPLQDPVSIVDSDLMLWPGTGLMPKLSDELISALDQVRRDAANDNAES